MFKKFSRILNSPLIVKRQALSDNKKNVGLTRMQAHLTMTVTRTNRVSMANTVETRMLALCTH